MTVALTITHVVSYRIGDQSFADGIAEAAGSSAPSVTRYFVPGFLPCGECGRCRRALVGACRSPRRPLLPASETAPLLSLDLPARFVAPLDEPLGIAPLSPEIAAAAGPVAFALFALATANLVPGDVAIWIGEGPLPALGAVLGRAAGAQLSVWASPNMDVPSALADVAATEGEHGTRKRVIFLVGPDRAAWKRASALTEPGGIVVILGPAPGALPLDFLLPSDARLLHLSAYHPDFLPEAFAALRRDEALLTASVTHRAAERTPFTNAGSAVVALTVEAAGG